jgi:hypothetical protein
LKSALFRLRHLSNRLQYKQNAKGRTKPNPLNSICTSTWKKSNMHVEFLKVRPRQTVIVSGDNGAEFWLMELEMLDELKQELTTTPGSERERTAMAFHYDNATHWIIGTKGKGGFTVSCFPKFSVSLEQFEEKIRELSGWNNWEFRV